VHASVIRTLSEEGQTLTLRKRDGAFELFLGNILLLSSAALQTERIFGQLAREFGARRNVIVGGLGFGATARGVLDVIAADARVTVVEKLGTVVSLVRGELAHLSDRVLEDARVTLVQADVLDVIAREHDVDAILLDVDNGPEWASFRTNARLYAPHGLALANAALAPGGSIAVWSGYPVDRFLAQLRTAGFDARSVPLRERGVVRARAYVGTKRS
jgi:hypothetical protein